MKKWLMRAVIALLILLGVFIFGVSVGLKYNRGNAPQQAAPVSDIIVDTEHNVHYPPGTEEWVKISPPTVDVSVNYGAPRKEPITQSPVATTPVIEAPKPKVNEHAALPVDPSQQDAGKPPKPPPNPIEVEDHIKVDVNLKPPQYSLGVALIGTTDLQVDCGLTCTVFKQGPLGLDALLTPNRVGAGIAFQPVSALALGGCALYDWTGRDLDFGLYVRAQIQF